MQRRWIVGIGVVAVAAGALFLLTRGDHASAKQEPAAEPSRAAPTAPRRAAPTRDVPTARAAVEPALPGLSDPTPGVKKWREPGLPGYFREVVAPDGTENVEEKLLYKKRRLRFRLGDAAASCYDGPEVKGARIALAYTMVLKDGNLTVENVRVLEDTVRDASVSECIIGAVKAMRTTAPELPDLREDQETTIELNDLVRRNRSAD